MAISHGQPCGGKGVLPPNLIRALEALWVEARGATTLTAVVVVLRGVRALGVALVASRLEERDLEFRRRGLELRCPMCGKTMKRDRNLRQVRRMTLLGKVTYRRCRFRCRCGYAVFPLDEQLSVKKLLHGHSDESAGDVVLLCTVMPFGRGCELFARFYGFVVSTHLARALTLADAQRKACIQWVNPLLDELFEGNVANVIQRLRKLKPSAQNACDEVRKCIEYFDEHKKRMHYASFKQRGLLIGSGAVESLHAWVIQARCRLPGMRWSAAGVNAMLRLRCSWASRRFDEDFNRAADPTPSTPQDLEAAA